MELNPVLRTLGRYPLATIAARVADRRDRGLPVIDFSIGDPREPTPPFIADALRDAVPAVSQYPTAAGRRELREAIARYVQRRFGVDVDPESQVIPTSGSKEAIFSTAFAFIDPHGDRCVVVPTPGYPVYERGALFAGATVERVVLGDDFVLRADDIPETVWGRASMVWTCSPHNPAGSVTSAGEFAELVDAARRHGSILLSDECYADVYDEDAVPGGPASVLQVAGPGARGVVAYLSLSKRSGMTGYRSGAIVGDSEAIEALRALRSTTGTASPDFIQAAAAAAWSDDDHAAERRRVFAQKRRVLAASFSELGMAVTGSQAGLYLWVRVGDDETVTQRLLDRGIVVAPGRSFGPGGEGFVRLALVPTLGECEAAADELVRALE